MRLKEVMDEMMEKAGVNDESLESVGPTQVANCVLLYMYNMSGSITVVNMRVNTVYCIFDFAYFCCMFRSLPCCKGDNILFDIEYWHRYFSKLIMFGVSFYPIFSLNVIP